MEGSPAPARGSGEQASDEGSRQGSRRPPLHERVSSQRQPPQEQRGALPASRTLGPADNVILRVVICISLIGGEA